MLGTATDIAGEVVEVGSGVNNFKAGDKVVAILSHIVSIIFHFYNLCYFISLPLLS